MFEFNKTQRTLLKITNSNLLLLLFIILLLIIINFNVTSLSQGEKKEIYGVYKYISNTKAIYQLNYINYLEYLQYFINKNLQYNQEYLNTINNYIINLKSNNQEIYNNLNSLEEFFDKQGFKYALQKDESCLECFHAGKLSELTEEYIEYQINKK